MCLCLFGFCLVLDFCWWVWVLVSWVGGFWLLCCGGFVAFSCCWVLGGFVGWCVIGLISGRDLFIVFDCFYWVGGTSV